MKTIIIILILDIMQPLHKLNNQNSGGPRATKEEAMRCKTAMLLDQTVYTCEVCGGRGHSYYECPTKRKLDHFAKANGESFIWGSWKWHAYYHKFTEEEIAAHKSYMSRSSYGSGKASVSK